MVRPAVQGSIKGYKEACYTPATSHIAQYLLDRLMAAQRRVSIVVQPPHDLKIYIPVMCEPVNILNACYSCMSPGVDCH